jgi:hypothetical protein
MTPPAADPARETFKDAVRLVCPWLSEADVEVIALNADEYAAHLIERYARPPKWEEGIAS